MLDNVFHFLAGNQEAPDLERLRRHLPYEWTDEAIAYPDRASIRQRRLPAEQIVWLVIVLALHQHQSIN